MVTLPEPMASERPPLYTSPMIPLGDFTVDAAQSLRNIEALLAAILAELQRDKDGTHDANATVEGREGRVRAPKDR